MMKVECLHHVQWGLSVFVKRSMTLEGASDSRSRFCASVASVTPTDCAQTDNSVSACSLSPYLLHAIHIHVPLATSHPSLTLAHGFITHDRPHGYSPLTMVTRYFPRPQTFGIQGGDIT
jgi:hypothetical protein